MLALALLAVTVVAPGPSSAAGEFEFNILRTSCVTTGRDFGHGEVLLKVRVSESGLSGANKFTLGAVAQHYKARTDTWQTEYTWDTFKVTFPNDVNSYFHKRWFAYDPNDKHMHQIVVVIKVWHNRKVLASQTLTSEAC